MVHATAMGIDISATALIHDVVSEYQPGSMLPGACYRDERIFAVDLARVFRRHWLFAGHVSRIARRGDYFTYAVGGDPILIARDNDGSVRAFFNVCRHRGALLCAEAAGNLTRIVCPYHQWVYGLDGVLESHRFMSDDFDAADSGLHRIHVRVIEGLIFICLADTPPDFGSVEHDLRQHLTPHDLASAKICSTRTYQVKANWKLIDENARECYHCPGSHPEYCAAVISAANATSSTGGERARARQVQQEERWRSLGLCTEGTPFRPGALHSVNRYALREGVVTESRDGRPVAPLMGSLRDRDAGVVGTGVYPNLLAEACSDHAVLLRFTPVAAELTQVEMTWLVQGDAQAGLDYRCEDVEAVWRATAEQDWQLCEWNQQGVNATGYRPGRYAFIEYGCDHFDRWYIEQISRE